jgi:rhamnopyranosyl-N-acetylglucosaminyl-diphospho-decaprenol beta-1,3/1,4-galactofuranosyltransferase
MSDHGKPVTETPGAGSPPAGVTAVVLTHMRPRMAGDVTRSLLDREGLAGDQVVVVVNGPGGLDDPELEASVRMVRLPRNTGPAGGFRAGMEEAFSDPGTRWVYLCEDDIGLFTLPTPRIAAVLDRLTGLDSARPVGAAVAYGRTFVGRGAHTVNIVPQAGPDGGFTPVDVACWGATLVSRQVFEAGVLPDPDWFFGLEDFDFFCRVREAGFDVVVDDDAARSVATQQTSVGRDDAIRAARPNDSDEVWRAYYHARNSVELARRHGDPTWYAWHVAYSARHLQQARTPAAWSAILHGLWDGARGRMGENPRYVRRVGEFGSSAEGVPTPAN